MASRIVRLRDIRHKYIPTAFIDSNLNKHAFVKLLQSNDVDLLIKFSKFILLGLREYGHVNGRLHHNYRLFTCCKYCCAIYNNNNV